MDRRDDHTLDTVTRSLDTWTRRWLRALTAGLLGLALWLARTDLLRAVFLCALVLVAFVPFAYARLRLQHSLAATLGPRLGHRLLIAGGSPRPSE